MSNINVTNSKPVNTKYSNVFKLIPVVILSTTVSLTGCAGRTADPVNAYKVTDSGMGCSEIFGICNVLATKLICSDWMFVISLRLIAVSIASNKFRSNSFRVISSITAKEDVLTNNNIY